MHRKSPDSGEKETWTQQISSMLFRWEAGLAGIGVVLTEVILPSFLSMSKGFNRPEKAELADPAHSPCPPLLQVVYVCLICCRMWMCALSTGAYIVLSFFLHCMNVYTIKCMCVWQARLTKEHRWGSTLLSRHQSLEEEFERAKAAVEVRRVQLRKKPPTSAACQTMPISTADF